MTNGDKLIARYLEEVETVYPDARKDRARARMQSFWNGEPVKDRVPYVALHLEGVQDIPEDISLFDRELIGQLSAIARHGREWDDDYYPALSPGVRQLTLPSYFGCVEEFSSESVKVKPVISDPEQVYSLPRLAYDDPAAAGGDMLARMRRWREATDGRISVYETDMQGPFSVASQIWGIEEFLLACYDTPDEVHYLINACTEVLIGFTRRMLAVTKGDLIPLHCMPYLWYPKEKGMAVSEDLVAVVSPGIVEEFMNPYLTKIADAFGGVTVHTCGNMNHVIPALCEVPGLVGLNFSSSETDLKKALRIKRSDVRILCHGSPVKTEGLSLLTPLEHAKYCGDCAREAGQQLACYVANVDGTLNPDMDGEIRKLLSKEDEQNAAKQSE